MSRQKIKELIHELHKPGANKSAILGEIIKAKKALGDKVAEPEAKKADKAKDKPQKESKSKKRGSRKKKKD